MRSEALVLPLLAGIVVAAPQGDSPSRSSLVVKRHPKYKAGPNDKTGSASAVLNGGVEYLSQVNVAGTDFQVVLDTGSADTWLFCTEGDDKMETNRTVYNPKTGMKFKDKSKFEIKYGEGHASGPVYADKLTIGGITVDQTIGCATDVDQNDVNDRNLDGIIGLGFDSGCVLAHNGRDAESKAKSGPLSSVYIKQEGFLGWIKHLFGKDKSANAQMTFTENAFPLTKEGIFTVDLKKDEDGVYNFGYVDAERFSTQLTYMPVVNWNQWIVKTSGYQVGKDGQQKTSEKKALIDTGTTNIILDKDSAKDYYSKVPKSKTTDSKNWIVPCKPEDAAMPDFLITFTPPKPEGDTHYPAGKGSSQVEKPYTATVPGNLLIGGSTGKDDMCFGAISTMDKGNGWDFILGDKFLLSQLVVFDLANPNGNSKNKDLPSKGQIGFAPKP